MLDHIRAAGEQIVPLDYDEVTSEDLTAYLGVTNKDVKGNRYMLVKGVANALVGSVVTIDSAGVTALLTAAIADNEPLKGVLCAAADAATKYCWALLEYEADAAAKFGPQVDGASDSGASTGANVILYTGATAGRLRSGATVAGQRPVRDIVLDTAFTAAAGQTKTASWHFGIRTTT